MLLHRHFAVSHIAVNTTEIGTEQCILRSLEENSKGIRGVGGTADNGAYTVHTIDYIALYYIL
jgi:hypothetical protein